MGRAGAGEGEAPRTRHGLRPRHPRGMRWCVSCRVGNVDITFKSDSKHVRMGLRALGTRASCRYIRSPK